MTITYSDGTVRKAIVLSHDENEIRAISAGCSDVLAFTRIHGTWISEDIEPVTIEFEWQRREPVQVACEDDYICPKALAAKLIEMLVRGDEDDLAPVQGDLRALLAGNLARRNGWGAAPMQVD